MEESKLRELIRERESSGRISCRDAMDIADRSGMPRIKIGKLLNEMKIKIGSCQLGCFK